MPLNTIFDPRELLGRKIGDYELQEVLGTGNSAVFRAYDSGKKEWVALKLVAWPGAYVEKSTLKRFEREIQLLRKRRHRHIIDIYDWRTSGEYVYLVMEACDGTLSDWSQHHHPTLSEALTILEPLAEAIDSLHIGPEPVIHRDIKPQNILFKGNHWYLSDFSIARGGEADQQITNNGLALGTLRYASPEQIKGFKPGPETDIYSFGLVVFEMLAGGWVFADRDATNDWVYAVPDLHRYNPQIPRDVNMLFKRWLDGDPARRPRRAVQAIHELGALAGILRDPGLARLYDLAAELSSQPRDPESWHDALALLDVIRGHMPQFSDPRGIADIVQRRLDGLDPGPKPAGYTGKPLEFYSEATLNGAEPTRSLPAPAADPARKILRPVGMPAEDFVPRSRYEADAELHVPAEIGVGGSVFGRSVVIEDTALVRGDVYSLGDVTVGAKAEIGGSIIAGGTVTIGQDAKVNGAAGVQAAILRIESGVRVEGWASTLREAALSPGADVEGIIAGGDLVLAEDSRSFSPSAASVGGEVQLEDGALLADMPVSPDYVRQWVAQPSSDGSAATKGQIASALMSAELQALTREIMQDAGPPPALPTPAFPAPPKPAPLLPPAPVAPAPPDPAPADTASQPATPITNKLAPEQVPENTTAVTPAPEATPAPAPVAPPTPPPTPVEVAPADPTRLEVGMIEDGPAVFRESVIRVLGQNGPEELPTETERALAAAWLLDRAWTDYGQRVRLPALVVGLAVLLALGLTIILSNPLPLLAWIIAAAGLAAISWKLRPQPLRMAKVYWAWHSFAGSEGAMIWDTRRAASDATYPELLSNPAELAPLVEHLGDTHDDMVLLGSLRKLMSGLATLGWRVWPGVFDLHSHDGGQGAAGAIRQLDLQRGLPSEIARLPVLRPVASTAQVRGAAAWLRAWPNEGGKQRRAIAELAGQMKAANAQAALWNNAREEAQRRTLTLKRAWDVQRSHANEVAEKTFAALLDEVEPDALRARGFHDASATLIGEHYGNQRQQIGAELAAAKTTAEQQVKRTQEELERQDAALRKLEGDLAPIPVRWKEEASKHEAARAALQEQWDQLRANLARQETQGSDPFVRPRHMDLRSAIQHMGQLGDAATPMERRLDELQSETVAAERSLGSHVPWPQWPTTIGTPTEGGAVARDLNAFARKLRAETASVHTRLDNATNLRAGGEYTLEGVLGALEALEQGLIDMEQHEDSVTDPETGRIRSLRSRADAAARALRRVVNTANRLQRRLQAAEGAYNDFAEAITAAAKESRVVRPWEEGRQLRSEYERLTLARETAQATRNRAATELEQAKGDRARKGEEETREMQRLAGVEQTLVRRSHAIASRDERQLRRHIDDLKARHEATIAALRGRDPWPDALGRFETGCFDLRVSALEHLRGRIGILCDGATQRLAQTEARRNAALWPAEDWPAGEMRHLVPVWLLLYRPGGSRKRERLVALTPADLSPQTHRLTLRPAAGFNLDEDEGLSELFHAEVLAPLTEHNIERIPGHINLQEPAARANLLKAWAALAADKWVPGWLKRAL